MIKGYLDTARGRAIFIGLSRQNMERLLHDEPIVFDLSEIGLPEQEVVIMGGETEDAISKKLSETIPVTYHAKGNFSAPGEGKSRYSSSDERAAHPE